MSELPSFLARKALPKPSRWFAWHECAHQQLKEFFATRCLLHWYFEDEGLPAPEAVTTQFQKCKGDLGGLKLLHRALTYVNHETACIMLLVSRPCWTCYTEHISEIKIPQQGVEQLMSWALSWHKDDHLLAIVKTLYDWRSLKKLVYYQVHQGRNDDDDLAATVFKYASNVLSRRLWTMSRHGTAPECFVGLVSSCVDHRQEAMGRVRMIKLMLLVVHKCFICPNVSYVQIELFCVYADGSCVSGSSCSSGILQTGVPISATSCRVCVPCLNHIWFCFFCILNMCLLIYKNPCDA